MFKTILIALGSFAAGAVTTAAFSQFLPLTAPPAEQTRKPNITHDCTAAGSGSGSCSFLNEGDGEGTLCVVVYLERREDTERIKKGFIYFKTPTLRTIYSNKVCSGPLVPHDTRQTHFNGFRNFYGIPIAPADFCEGNTTVSWTRICNLTTQVAAETEAELQVKRHVERERYFFPWAVKSSTDTVPK